MPKAQHPNEPAPSRSSRPVPTTGPELVLNPRHDVTQRRMPAAAFGVHPGSPSRRQQHSQQLEQYRQQQLLELQQAERERQLQEKRREQLLQQRQQLQKQQLQRQKVLQEQRQQRQEEQEKQR